MALRITLFFYYAEYPILFIVWLNAVIMLTVAMLTVVMLKVVMLNVIILSVI